VLTTVLTAVTGDDQSDAAPLPAARRAGESPRRTAADSTATLDNLPAPAVSFPMSHASFVNATPTSPPRYSGVAPRSSAMALA